MNKSGKVFFNDDYAGIITESDDDFVFEYDEQYYLNDSKKSISLTLPKTQKKYTSSFLFPFFDGLIPEGWLLDLAQETWKIDRNDRMELLLRCCKDVIGAVSIIPLEKQDD